MTLTIFACPVSWVYSPSPSPCQRRTFPNLLYHCMKAKVLFAATAACNTCSSCHAPDSTADRRLHQRWRRSADHDLKRLRAAHVHDDALDGGVEDEVGAGPCDGIEE